MEWLVIYLLVQIEVISAMIGKFGILIFFGVVIGAVTMITASMHACDSRNGKFSEVMAGNYAKRAMKWSKTCIITGIVCFVLAGLLPTQKNLAIIVGSGVVYNVVTSDSAQRIGNKAIDALEKKVDEILTEKDTTPEAEPTAAQAQAL